MPDFRDLFEEFPDQAPVWYGTFAKDVNDFIDLAPVIIPEFDPHLQWGPCRWQSRDATSLPRKGDQCLIIFDDRREPWVVAWWPF